MAVVGARKKRGNWFPAMVGFGLEISLQINTVLSSKYGTTRVPGPTATSSYCLVGVSGAVMIASRGNKMESGCHCQSLLPESD